MAGRNSIDGFRSQDGGAVDRRPRSLRRADGSMPRMGRSMTGTAGSSRSLATAEQPRNYTPRRSASISTNNPSSSLTDFDINPSDNIFADLEQGSSKRGRKGRKKPQSTRRKWIKRIIIALVIIGVGFGGMLLWRAFMASSHIFKGDIFGLIQQKELKADSNGRSNILLLGTSEDDPGHEGSYLTDSIMILSISQSKKDAYMISIPRDLYVKYRRSCNSGNAGKINEYFNCVNSDWSSTEAEDERQAASRKFFGNIVGLDLQYSVHVNYTVLRDLVSALGGIKVTIESRDPRGQMDGNFDWKCKGGNARASHATMVKNCPPNGHFIDYPNGPVDLDAEHALYLAQARGASGISYGFEQSNFDREKNQQKVLVAIKEKATSAGTLTNFGAVTGIIDALGKNLRTNFETSEIRTLMSLGQNIKSDAIKSVSLLDTPVGDLVVAQTVNGISSVVPAAGTYDYSQIQAYINKTLNATEVSKESAHVVVLNASGASGVAKREADKLEKLGMVIDSIDNAPSSGSAGSNKIYQVAGRASAPNTKAKLESIYHAQVTTGTPPVTTGSHTQFVVVVGQPTTGTSSAISD